MAEVLITLGIIGVVAALTLPSLIQKYQDQVLENQLKKMYSTLSQGIQKAMADDGVSNFGDTELVQSCGIRANEADPEPCIQMVKKYFNVVEVKTDRREYYDNVIQCKNIDGKKVCSRDKSKRELFWYLGRYATPIRYVLVDGSEFTFSAFIYGDGFFVYIDIDTNGEKGPNTEGLDTFGLEVDKNSRFGGRGWVVEAIQKNNWKFPW